MAYSDYSFCIYCDELIYILQIEKEVIVYLCSMCGNSISVRNENEGLLSDSGYKKGR